MNLEELDKKANPGAFSTFDAAILVPEVEKLKPEQVYLEVGVDRGKSLSIARMVAKKGVVVVGVDICEDPNVPDTDFFREDSTLFDYGVPIHVIFIDGDHSYKGCKADIDNWFPQMADNGVMLFHDCDASSPGVVQAVEEFVKENDFKDVYYDPNQRCSMARVRLQ